MDGLENRPRLRRNTLLVDTAGLEGEWYAVPREDFEAAYDYLNRDDDSYHPGYKAPRFESLRRTLTGWECDAYYIASRLAMAVGLEKLGDRLGQRSLKLYCFLRVGFVR